MMETVTGTESLSGEPRPPWLVVIGASAGGLQALSLLLAGMPADFPAAIAVVQHLDPRYRSYLATILSHRTTLAVRQADEGMRLRAGLVAIAPPNHHLLVNADGSLSLSSAPPVNFCRPSADVLFASAATAYGAQAIAVVLTGTGSDGSTGIRSIKQAGGITIAQDVASSQFPGMPGAAVRTGHVDWVLPFAAIAPMLTTLVIRGDDR